MGKETKGESDVKLRAIREGATSLDVPISDNYQYVRGDDTFLVDNAEFELVQHFLKFVRNRERGVFNCEIVNHKNHTRYARLQITDQDLIELLPLDGT